MDKNRSKKIVFVCELPPPFGGVTVKNKLLLDYILNGYDTEVIDMYDCKRSIFNILPISLKLFKVYRSDAVIIYGLGSGRRLETANWLQYFIGGKKSLSKSLIIVMGGWLPRYLKGKQRYIRLLNSMRALLIETEGMKSKVTDLGVSNVDIFPNAKSSAGSTAPKSNKSSIVKCLFFSKICEGKGIRDLISMYELMSEEERRAFEFDFYGHIDRDIKNDFESFVAKYDNVHYYGVFDATKGELYSFLNGFDILLFPTRFDREGVPGILVESKMSGIVPIVSNLSHNAEIVRDGEEGIVVSADALAENMKAALLRLTADRELLYRFKIGSFASRDRYSLENYREKIAGYIEGTI